MLSMTPRVRHSSIVVSWLLVFMAGSTDAQGIHSVSSAALSAILAEPLVTPATGSIHSDVTVVELSAFEAPGLDGSAKGGIAVAIAYELGLPVKLVGVGEGIDDLRPFDPQDFAEALFAA